MQSYKPSLKCAVEIAFSLGSGLVQESFQLAESYIVADKWHEPQRTWELFARRDHVWPISQIAAGCIGIVALNRSKRKAAATPL